MSTDRGFCSYATLASLLPRGVDIHAASSKPRHQQQLIDEMLYLIAADLLPERPGRSEPRTKKRRPKNYQLLTKPRSQMGNVPHRNRPNPKRPKAPLT